MDVTVTLRNGEVRELERVHLYGAMAIPDFISFFQREDDFDPESPIATKGFHFLRTEVANFQTQSDEIDVEQTRKRLDVEKDEKEKNEWDLKQLDAS